MSLADTQYLQIIENILDHGYYANNRTGIATYKLPHQVMQFRISYFNDKICGFQNGHKRAALDLAVAI